MATAGLQLQLFGQPPMTAATRVLACLFEQNLNFELVRTDTSKGEHMLPQFVKMRARQFNLSQDPSGQVMFKHGATILTDSRAICRYLCVQFPKNRTGLYGTGSLERAKIENWLKAEARRFHAPSSKLVFHLAFAPHLNTAPDEACIAENEEKLEQVLTVYDETLANNLYLAGDEFTLVDLFHLPNSHYIVSSERGRKLFSSKKNVARWYEVISERWAWKLAKVASGNPSTFEP